MCKNTFYIRNMLVGFLLLLENAFCNFLDSETVFNLMKELSNLRDEKNILESKFKELEMRLKEDEKQMDDRVISNSDLKSNHRDSEIVKNPNKDSLDGNPENLDDKVSDQGEDTGKSQAKIDPENNHNDEVLESFSTKDEKKAGNSKSDENHPNQSGNSNQNSYKEKDDKANQIYQENNKKEAFNEDEVHREAEQSQISKERIDAIIAELRANKERRDKIRSLNLETEIHLSSYTNRTSESVYFKTTTKDEGEYGTIEKDTNELKTASSYFKDKNDSESGNKTRETNEESLEKIIEHNTGIYDSISARSSSNIQSDYNTLLNDNTSITSLFPNSSRYEYSIEELSGSEEKSVYNNQFSNSVDNLFKEEPSQDKLGKENYKSDKDEENSERNQPKECAIPEHKVEAKDIGKVDLDRIKAQLKDAEKYEHDFATVQGGMHILNAIFRNLDFLKEKGESLSQIGKIKGILIYKSENGEYNDYWGKLKFHKENNQNKQKHLKNTYWPKKDELWIDETGLFQGELCDKFEDIPEFGVLTPNGFFQSKRISKEELASQFTTIKILIEEIAQYKNTTIPELFKENNDISITDRLIFAHSYNDMLKDREKFKDCVIVCVCRDSFCKEPCEEIRYVDRRDLK